MRSVARSMFMVAALAYAGATLAARQTGPPPPPAPVPQPPAVTTPTPEAAQPPPRSAAPTAKPEEGIPIPDPVVQKACGPCHKLDDKQQLSRISFQRNTPEGWQETIRRMVALNGLRIEPETAREVVRYLSNNLGLAPEEARPAAFEVERRLIDYKYKENADAEAVCIKCHSMGRVISQRRTREEWDLLIAMHRGWYPLVDNQAFRRSGPPPREAGADGRPADRRQPVDRAIEHLARAFPLKTPEWAAWSATMRPARLEGTWALTGNEIGKGAIVGRVAIKAVAGSADEFTTETTYTYARTGETVTRTGRTIVYTGYQWRGRSSRGAAAAPTTSAPPGSNESNGANGAEAAQPAGRARPSDEDSTLREVMFVDRDWRVMDGRWFTGGYDEIGLDVRLERLGGEPRLLGTNRTMLRAGVSGDELRIFGANLPATLQTADIDLGPGTKVVRVVSSTPDVLTVEVDVAPGAVVGVRDVFVAGASLRKAFAVYDRIDGIKVTPTWAMARVGGVTFPKGLAQFEARAFHNGIDKRPDTADDVDLGMVPAAWSLEEYAVTYDDDDIKFVGSVDAKTGRFVPNVEGPNPARRGNRNNIGDVWMVATYTPDAVDGKPGRALRARAHLLVTVPVYMRWELRGQ